MEGRRRFIFLVGAFFFALILLSFGKGQAHEHEGDCYVFSGSWTCLEEILLI